MYDTAMTFALTLQAVFIVLWIGWLAVFLIIETIAILLARKFDDKLDETQNDGGTFSSFVWRLTKRNMVIFAIFTIFWSWLSYHFIFQG